MQKRAFNERPFCMKKATAYAMAFFQYILLDVELLLELFYTTACINKLLLTCVEGVTLGADFNVDGFLNRTCFENRATCTLDSSRTVVRMDTFSHYIHLFLKCWYMKIIIIFYRQR